MDFRNSNLRTLAVVEAQLTKGLERPTEYLIPFFQATINKREGQHLVLDDLLDDIKNDYSLEIPVYLADSLVTPLLRRGSLERDDRLGCYICKTVDLGDGDASLNQADFDLLDNKLTEFAKNIGLEKPMASQTWQLALLAFFSQSESANKFGTLNGKIIGNARAKDDWVVSKFIIECQSLETRLFNLIKTIYAAYAFADTVISIQNIGHLDNWNNLNVLYDSTVLMRLLGTSGESLKRATLEMHQMLQDMGCSTFYFDHTLHEVLSNLDALTLRYSHGQPLHRETAQALESAEITMGQINMLKGEVDIKLAQLNITQLELPERLADVSGQVNPDNLESFLKSNINYRNNSEASRADSESIEKILFLRKGKKATELPKSQFLFVTHNSRYARHAATYCRETCKYTYMHTPPIVTLSNLTRVAWLASEKGGGLFDASTELIVNCHQASLPDEKWFGMFWRTIEQTNPELLDINAHDSLYLLDIRRAAENITLGSSALLDTVDVSTLISKAKEALDSRESKHNDELESLRAKSKEAIRLHLLEKEALEKEKEESLLQERTEAERIKRETEEQLRADANKEIEIRENRWRIETAKETENARNAEIGKMRTNIDRKASSNARRMSKTITFFIALIFAYIFYLSQQTSPPAWILPQSIIYIKYISGVLGAIQIIGLFVPRFSLLFMGPWIEKKLTAALKHHYQSLVE